MARQQKLQINLEVTGLEKIKKDFEAIDQSNTGLYSSAQNIIKQINTALDLMKKYDRLIPVDKAEELSQIFDKITDDTASLSIKKKVSIITKEDIERVEQLNKELEELKKTQQSLQKKLASTPSISTAVNKRITEIKGQKTVRGTTADGRARDYQLSKLPKWDTEKDLQRISKDTTLTENQRNTAVAILAQIEKAAKKTATEIQQVTEELNKVTKDRGNVESQIDQLKNKTRELTTEELRLLESMTDYGVEQERSLNAGISNSKRLGKSFLDVDKNVNKMGTSFGKVAKTLLNWQIIWNLMKQMGREAVRTVTEMDKALTGMAVVTGQTREEVTNLIPRIQQLANTTSTALTDVAGLVTEYTRQGRSLSDSFVLAEETAKSAKIAGISTADSITYLTAAINGFNLAAREATRVSDIFANLAAVSATDYEQLAIALSKVSAQANLAGMSIEYTTALLAKGIETTQEAPESIGTALKTIIARMRELTDYGSTLEDGATVNKVEAALNAAGIELRNVNGEFRELEDIFNELGPKWDNLNTMQQQAIAQAVAGTR